MSGLSDEAAIALLDDAADRLIRGYEKRGLVCYVVRTLSDGNLRLRGSRLMPEQSAAIFRTCAAEFVQPETSERVN